MKYYNFWLSSFSKWYIPAHPPITKSNTILPPRYWETKGIMHKGTNIDFSWTWYENMKKVIEMQLKAKIRTFWVGLSIRAIIEGTLNTIHSMKHKNVKIGLEIQFWYLKRTSDKHQKLGTLSWYNPRWTGKIAYNTDENVFKELIQGSQIIKVAVKTIIP